MYDGLMSVVLHTRFHTHIPCVLCNPDHVSFYTPIHQVSSRARDIGDVRIRRDRQHLGQGCPNANEDVQRRAESRSCLVIQPHRDDIRFRGCVRLVEGARRERGFAVE